MVLGLPISGIIGLGNGYGCDQEDETNLTMVLDVISMSMEDFGSVHACSNGLLSVGIGGSTFSHGAGKKTQTWPASIGLF